MSFFSKILTSPSIFKSQKIIFNLLNTENIIWRILLLYYLNARNLVGEALNQRKMNSWFNLEKNHLKNIANYPCILYLKFLWYCRNKMLWDRFNQQNHENKILGWKNILSKKLSKRFICILYIKHSLSQEIKAGTILTTIKSTQKLINADCLLNFFYRMIFLWDLSTLP